MKQLNAVSLRVVLIAIGGVLPAVAFLWLHLSGPSDGARNELDLTELNEQLIAVVQETMQPTRVSLWLRKLEQPRKRNTRLLTSID